MTERTDHDWRPGDPFVVDDQQRLDREELLSRTSQIELTSLGAQRWDVYPGNGLRNLSITLTPPAGGRRPGRKMTNRVIEA